MSRVQSERVSVDESGMRLDRWFHERFPTLGHGQLQKLLRTGQVRVDGARAKANLRLRAGQEIRVPPLPERSADDAKSRRNARHPELSGEDERLLPSRIVHRDEDIIVIDKPAGLASQGGSGVHRHVDGLLDTLRFEKRDRPRLVHRLDRDTSGLLVLARDRLAAQHLTKAFKTRDVQKLYWAVSAGVPSPESGRVDAPLAKLRAGGGGAEKMAIDEARGDRAVTLYRVVQHASKIAAWVALEPLTGRTHQLRVHLAAIGTPILGDGKYGGAMAFPEIDGVERRLHLHARGLRFRHPRGDWMSFTAEPPPHMIKAWRSLGFDSSAGPGDEFLASE